MNLANDTIYGLAAAVWTRDMGVSRRLSRAIRAGTVWINAYDPSSPRPSAASSRPASAETARPAIDKYMDFKTIWTHYR